MKYTIHFLLALCLTLSSAFASVKQHYSIGVRITGHGKPMIIIPGLKGSADTYNDLVAHYAGRYTCYVITLSGFAGQQPSGAHDHLLLKQCDEIIQYIIEQHLKRPVIVGFSFGGVLATWIATSRPDLAGPLVDIDGTPFDASMRDNFNKDTLIKTDSTKYAQIVDETPAYWKMRDSAFHSPATMKQSDAKVWRMISDTARYNEIDKWDIASDFRSSTLMRIEADTIDMRQSVAHLQAPVLVLGSWVT